MPTLAGLAATIMMETSSGVACLLVSRGRRLSTGGPCVNSCESEYWHPLQAYVKDTFAGHGDRCKASHWHSQPSVAHTAGSRPENRQMHLVASGLIISKSLREVNQCGRAVYTHCTETSKFKPCAAFCWQSKREQEQEQEQESAMTYWRLLRS